MDMWNKHTGASRVTLAGTLVLLALSATAAQAAPIFRRGTNVDPQGSYTIHSDNGVQSVVVCDVMRDYEYVDGTGEFIAWVGPPYLANCHTVGSGGTGPTCAPGDLICECAQHPNSPNCHEPGGPDDTPPDCRGGGKGRAGGPPCPNRCKVCFDKANADAAVNAAVLASCREGWAPVQAAQLCLAGQTRFSWPGTDRGLLLLIHAAHGNHVGDAIIPAFQDCFAGWMTGRYTQTTTDSVSHQSGGGITVVAPPVNGAVSHQDTSGQSVGVTVPGGEGFTDLCATWNGEAFLKSYNDFKTCSEHAVDRTPQNTCATGAVPGTSLGQ